MIKIIILIRNLIKNRVTSVITIAGYSISVSMAMVIIAFFNSQLAELESSNKESYRSSPI